MFCRIALGPGGLKRMMKSSPTISDIVSFSVENKVACGNGGGLVVAAQG